LLQHITEGIRLQNASTQGADGAGSGPSHALQKPATVNSVVVVIVNYSSRHSFSPKSGFQ
jgi:hypothetical protein